MKVSISVIATILFLSSLESHLFGQWSAKISMNSTTPIWLNSSLQRELELTHDQRREMFELALKYEEEYYPLARKRTELSRKVDSAQSDVLKKKAQNEYQLVKSEFEELRSRFEKKANEILLDHQLSRIVDIKLKRLLSSGFLRLMPHISKELGLNEKQVKEINTHLFEFNTRVSEAVVAELEKTKKNIVNSIPSSAKGRLTAILKDYEYRMPTRFDFVVLEQYFFKKVKKQN